MAATFKKVCAMLCAAATATFAAVAGTDFDAGEWPHYGSDLASSKYSPLDEINGENFSELEIAWRWQSADKWLSKSEAAGEWWGPADAVFEALQEEDPNRWRGGRVPRLSSLKATPLMVDGVLYMSTPLYQAAAIDAATGETRWVYNPKSYETGTPTMSLLWNHRGVAYWTGGEDARILWGTGDGYLLAVDAKTGRPCADFGENGRVDLMKGLPRADRSNRDYLNALEYSCASPPLVIGDVVVTGSSIADRRITKEAIPGDVRGWDVRTGELKWTFHTIPREGEFGVETWENGSWKYSGNANVWSMMSADPELGYVYLPTGTATNDYYGGHRLGDNLFAESVVCVDAETGERVWHFQTVHHGLWDYDNPCAPNLIDIVVDGKPIKALAQVTKQGFCFVFDRVTGKPVWPIEEREVPPTTMPGDRAAPTQPFPTKPPPFEEQGVSKNDLIDFTPELRKLAEEAIEGFDYGPLFTPPALAVDGVKGTIYRPSLGGGANWTGAAVDPETGWLYVPSRNSMSVIHFYTPDPKQGGTLRYTHGARGEYPRMPDRLPLFKPPYTRLTAYNLNTGEIAWQVATGDDQDLRNHPRLKDLDLPPLGGEGRTGPLCTKTMVMLGLSPGGRGSGDPGKLVAYNKQTGAVMGEIQIPRNPIGTPMTYRLNGKQYIALTMEGSPPELIALALPDQSSSQNL